MYALRNAFTFPLVLCVCNALGGERARAASEPSVSPSVGATPPTGVAQSTSQSKGIKRTLLAHHEVPGQPGFESRLYLVEYPPGAVAGLHAHTRQAVGYVLEGRFESAFGTGPVTSKHEGEGFIDLPDDPHRFRNPDSARPLRFVIAGTFRSDEPLFQPLAGPVGFDPPRARPAREAPEQTGPGGPSGKARLTDVKRTLLVQKAIDASPGLESRLYLIEFPPGAESKPHIHTVQGIGYVIEGSFESAFADAAPTITHAGEGFVDLPDKPHHFRNPDPARPLRFIFAGTFHKDEPLFQVIDPSVAKAAAPRGP